MAAPAGLSIADCKCSRDRLGPDITEYRHYADVRRKLSLDMNDATAKRQLMEMATVWTVLADEHEASTKRVGGVRALSS